MKSEAGTVKDYLEGLDDERRKVVSKLRTLVRKHLKGARESMAYGMPTWTLGEPVVAVAAQKNHFALYVCEAPALEAHRARFAHLDVGKGCIRFKRLDQLPLDAVQELLQDLAR